MAKDFASTPAPIGAEAANALPNINPYPFFDLAVHPAQWSFVEVESGVFEWLPDLAKVAYRPGINACVYGVQKLADGTTRKFIVNKDEVRQLRASKGYRFVERDGPAGDYLMVMQTQRGEHYHAAWEKYAHAEGFGVQRTIDGAAKIAFQRKLVEAELVPVPPPVFRQRAIAQATADAQRQAAAPKSEAQAAALAKANARLKAMQEAPPPGVKAVKALSAEAPVDDGKGAAKK